MCNVYLERSDSVINVKLELGKEEYKVPFEAIVKRAEAHKLKGRIAYKVIKEYIEVKYNLWRIYCK